MRFSHGFSRPLLWLLLCRYALLTLLNYLLLRGLLYLDNEVILSENTLAVLAIPIGLLNVAVIYQALRSLAPLYWKSLLYLLVAAFNFWLYIDTTLHMLSQSGSLINR